MNAIFRQALAVCGFAIATQASGQVTFYEHSGFRGQSVTVDRPAGSMERYGFANRASSAVVSGEPWEVCNGPGFSGRCVVLQPGRYDSLPQMNDSISSVRPLSARGGPTGSPPAPAGGGQITFHERKDFHGRSFTADGPVADFQRFGFNDRASSVVVNGGSWEVCDGPGHGGRCVVLRPGRYASLNEMGLNNRVSSARPAGAAGHPPGHPPSGGHVTLYEHSEFRGRAVTVDRSAQRLDEVGFNNAASSVVVVGQSWELCNRSGFRGQCVVLRPGRYPSLGSMNLNDAVSSVRPANR